MDWLTSLLWRNGSGLSPSEEVLVKNDDEWNRLKRLQDSYDRQGKAKFAVYQRIMGYLPNFALIGGTLGVAWLPDYQRQVAVEIGFVVLVIAVCYLVARLYKSVGVSNMKLCNEAQQQMKARLETLKEESKVSPSKEFRINSILEGLSDSWQMNSRQP